MSEKDDDLSIDFSGIGRKISSIFKAEGKAKHKAEHKAEHKPSEEKRDEDISIDFRRSWEFIVKHKSILILLIPLFIGIFLRAYPIYLPVTDDWAKNSVDRYYNSQVMDQINKQYPNLPQENKNAIANENLQKFISSNKDMYNQQIKQVSQNFKSQFQDDYGRTYILDIDPWQWYRYTLNIVDHGYPGDYIREDGVMMDNHMVAPIGNKVGKELHPYFGAYFHMFLRFFSPNISVMTSFFLLPLLLSALMIIPAFFIGRKVGGDLGGLFTSILIAVNPMLLGRTTAGVPDTDVYTIMFPLFILWFFFEAIDSENRKRAVIYSSLAGLVTMIFAATWYGWWYIFDFILAAMAVYLAYMLFIQKERFIDLIDIRKESRKPIVFLSLLCLFISSLIFISLIMDFSIFTRFYSAPFNFISFKESATPSLWPNVYTTVAELNEISMSQIIQSLGGKIIFAVSILGILLTLTMKRDGKIDPKYTLILSMWFIATLYASTKGVRFVNLLVPAFAIAIGAAVGISYRYLSKWITKELGIGKVVTNVILVILILMLLIAPVKAGHDTAKNQVPLINDAWYNSLMKIRTSSSKDAIVNSWWDFGHWFKAVTNRAVTFDGASQNRPQAHWIGKVLLTDNEDEAIGILRMLDCGALNSFEIINNETKNMHKSVDMLYDIVVLDKDKARDVLKMSLPDEKVEEVLKNTHCNPPEDYFITSEDMVGKAGVWAHFGSWDFEKAKIWVELKKKNVDEATAIMEKEFNYSKEKAQTLYYETQSITDEREANDWISPWPGYASGAGCTYVNNSTIQCVFKLGNQMAPFQIDLKSMEAVIETSNGKVYPSSISYLDKNNKFVEKKYQNNTIQYSIALLKKDDNYQGIIMSPQLASSMFTRLFYFDGAGLKHFEKLTHEVDASGQNIIVWKVNWEGKK